MRTSLVQRVTTVAVICGAAFSGIWIAGAQPQTNNPNFTGNVTKMEDTSKATIVKFKFDAGARTRWHSHSGGQIVMVEEGVGRHQIKGQPPIEMKAGDTIFVGPGVVHWHGASPNQSATQFNVTRGDVTWLDPVTDQEYTAAPKR
jgi:quercetin dioxygenase-like cupin family protein